MNEFTTADTTIHSSDSNWKQGFRPNEDLARIEWYARAKVDLTQADLLVERNKLGVLALASHREIRRSLEFLRFYEGDAASIAPSLYRPGKGNRPAAEEAPSLAAHLDGHAPVGVEADNAPVDPADNPFAAEET